MPGIAQQLIRTAESLGASAVSRKLHSGQVLIVMYHGVLPEPRDWDHWCQIPADEFRWQIEHLKTHYEVLPLSEIVARLAADEPLPPHTAAITFDDGLRNNFEVAFPILRELDVPATMYLATGYVGTDELLWQDRVFAEIESFDSMELDLSVHGLGTHRWNNVVARQKVFETLLANLKRLPVDRKNRALAEICRQTRNAGLRNPTRYDFQLMSWDNAAEMQASGLIEIGPHTDNHELLSRLSDDQIASEIVGSYEAVCNRLDSSSPTFAFPNGTQNDYDDRALKALRQCNIPAAVTTISGLNSRSQPLMQLKRVGIGADTTRWQFRAEISGLMDYLRALKSPPSERS
ncbi:MAG: polysaccharide deacetylase family protein [Rhodopirellula sp.]|nr:polysaccharide deacetylase family protein [Rhodopirellula sp.]